MLKRANQSSAYKLAYIQFQFCQFVIGIVPLTKIKRLFGESKRLCD